MSWSDVTVNATDIKKTPGHPYEGTFKGKKAIETKIGPQVVWLFSNDEGIPFGIYGFTNLNRAMESLEPGAVCQITYRGTEKVNTKFGLKDVHQVSVRVWVPESESEPASEGPF